MKLLALGAVLVCLGCSSARQVVVPGCTKAVQSASQLSGTSSTSVALPGQPFGVAVEGRYAFVTIGGFSAFPQLGVLELGHSPKLVRTIPLPVGNASGEAITAHGTRLLVAAGTGLTEIDVHAAETGHRKAVLGSLSSGGDAASAAFSAIDVVASHDGRYAFVSLEYAGRIAVFDLRRRRLVGIVRVPTVNVGLALSPNGRFLYATTASGAFPVTAPSAGSLTIVGVKQAERDPVHAIVGAVPAGCDPVRVLAAGGSVWVSARGSNALLEYSAAALRKDPAKALRAVVPVGAEPVGLALFASGRRLAVLDSDRYHLAGGKPSITVVDPSQAKAVGTVATGAFPREAVADGAGGLLVADFDAGEVQSLHMIAR